MNPSEPSSPPESDRQEEPAKLNASPAPDPPSAKPPVDWKNRRMRKNKLFLKWLGVLGVTVCFTVFCVILPLLMAHPPFGKTVLLAIPPNLFVTLSWMAGAWYTYDKNYQLSMALTIGMTPVRLAFFVSWFWLVSYIPGLNMGVLAVTVIVFWGLFAVPEFAMLASFTKNLQRTSEIEPDGDGNSQLEP